MTAGKTGVVERDLPTSTGRQCFDELVPALRRLDRLLERAMAAAQATFGPEAASDPYRGLYISHNEAARLLSLEPGVPTLWTDPQVAKEPHLGPGSRTSRLAWLEGAFGLSPFDLDVILLALAPELDLRYEKIYAYLQNDITRKRPTVELALNLLCPSAAAKLERRIHFSQQSSLIGQGLLHLLPDPNQVEPPLLAHYLKLDHQIAHLLLGVTALDPRLAPSCELVEPASGWNHLLLNEDVKHGLLRLVSHALATRRPLHLYFQGARGGAKYQTSEALAGATDMKLLTLRIDRLAERSRLDALWKVLVREARINNAILYIGELDDFRGQEGENWRQDLLDAVTTHDGITILAGRQAWIPGAAALGVIPIVFEIPELEERRACWKAQLGQREIGIEPHALEKLAARFRLTTAQITNAVATAELRSRWRGVHSTSDQDPASPSPPASPSLDDLSAAARVQCGHELANLARRIEPRYGWTDIVLPADQMAQLHEICCQAEYRHVVYGEWGFDRKLSLGKGLNVLFSGPPGTGKTMAAEVISRALHLDLYRIDLSQVISKYIGETEKNLDRIFAAAENSNAILFFDEADALFGKRSEVRDSHDRYANIEISYLLQKMEEYQGTSILATNLRQNLDEAFVRRLQAIVEFPFPDEEYRRRIWESVFPGEVPLGADVKFDQLAHEVRLAGGNIKNMALAAAFFAAADGGTIHMSHLLQAARREHQKLGRAWDDVAFRAAAKQTTAA
jgi:hypothetical protein